jgi:hypothetical protein
LHTVGDILTKISVNCVINLHVALLFACLFLWVYPMCGYNCLCSYGYCLYMLHLCVYFYFSMNLCNCIMHLSIYVIYIKFCNSYVCICLISCSSKHLCGIAQLDVGYVTICSIERTKVFFGVAWPGMGGRGCYNSAS